MTPRVADRQQPVVSYSRMPSLSNKLKMAHLQHRQRLLASTTQAKHLKNSAVTAHSHLLLRAKKTLLSYIWLKSPEFLKLFTSVALAKWGYSSSNRFRCWRWVIFNLFIEQRRHPAVNRKSRQRWAAVHMGQINRQQIHQFIFWVSSTRGSPASPELNGKI